MTPSRIVARWLVAPALILSACGTSSDDQGPAESTAGGAESNGADNAVGELAELSPGRNDLTIDLADGSTMAVTIITPPAWSSGDVTPAVLALPPGDQSEAMVGAVVGRYFNQATADQGWVVVSAALPDRPDGGRGGLFASDPAPLVELLDRLDGIVVAEGDRWHVAGPSNGGLSAFGFAVQNPDLVQSVIGLPGYPTEPAATEILSGIPVALYVGENDSTWRTPMQEFADDFEAAGGEVSLTVSDGEGHVLQNVSADELTVALEAFRP